jgi:hypothetical protein
MDSSGKALKGSGKPVSPAAGCLGPDAGGVDKGCNSLNAWGGSLLTDLLPAKLFCRQLRAWKNATWVEVLRFSALRKTLRWAGWAPAPLQSGRIGFAGAAWCTGLIVQ